jgi:hypothetical protein
LITAWNKLYKNAPMPFIIKESDPYKKSHSKGGAGGANALLALLNAHRADSPHIVIGVFDRDREGKRAYNSLHNDYCEDKDADWKISDQRKAGALLLSVPTGKEEYDRCENLCIEYYFSEQTLLKKDDHGIGLVFTFQPLTSGGITLLDDKQQQILETRNIKSGKKEFATSIVPSLDVVEFEPFKELIEKIINLIDIISTSSL